MRFFNLDLHISVIADIAHILRALGHEVTDWSISGHAWVFGREPAEVDIVNQHTWRSLDRALCDAFYQRYRTELEGYDAFIVTHTPAFAMLYERWNKPILCVASTRYEYPFTSNRATWEHFNDFLRTQIDSGLLIPLANRPHTSKCPSTTCREGRRCTQPGKACSTVYTRRRQEARACRLHVGSGSRKQILPFVQEDNVGSVRGIP